MPQQLALSARFEILRSLGQGGMGVVYEAIDREQRAPIALKMMRSSSGDAVLRLKTEFRSLRDRSPTATALEHVGRQLAGISAQSLAGIELVDVGIDHEERVAVPEPQ